MTRLKNSFKRKTWFLLPLCLLLGVLLLWGYSDLFTRANFPYTQPGTYWTDEDGILSVQVSEEPIQFSGLIAIRPMFAGTERSTPPRLGSIRVHRCTSVCRIPTV